MRGLPQAGPSGCAYVSSDAQQHHPILARERPESGAVVRLAVVCTCMVWATAIVSCAVLAVNCHPWIGALVLICGLNVGFTES